MKINSGLITHPQSFQILSVEIVNSSMYFIFSDYVRKKTHKKKQTE